MHETVRGVWVPDGSECEQWRTQEFCWGGGGLKKFK